MDKELISSFDAALKRFSEYEKRRPLPSGYAFIPTVNRALRGNREWYKSTWPKYQPGPFDTSNKGSWFGDLKGRRIPWVQLKGEQPRFPLIVRGADSDAANTANRWAQREMQWLYSFDNVEKQNEVRLAATSSNAIVPYDVGYAAKQSAKYGFTGPMPDESYYGPTREGATGFEYHATMERIRKEDERRRAEESEVSKNHRLAESRGSIRNRRERIALMKEFPTFFRNSKMSTKDMREIAKTLRAIRRTPIIGEMVLNPIGAAATIFGLQKAAFGILDTANKESVDWQNLALMTGGGKDIENAAYLAGLKNPGEIMSTLGKFQSKYGPAANDVLSGFGSILASSPAEMRSLIASRLGLDTKSAALSMALANPEMFKTEQRITNAEKNKIEAMKTLGFSSGSSFADTFNAVRYSLFGGAFARVRNSNTTNIIGRRKELYDDVMERLVYGANEARQVAEVDDQYAAGKFETYNETNERNTREVNVQMNLGGVTVSPGGNASDFVDELISIGTNGMSQSRSVIDAFDTKRKK